MFRARAHRSSRTCPLRLALISVAVMSLVACSGGPGQRAGETEVRPPTDWPAELPADRGVGPVALGYVAGGVSYVVLENGEHYLVPGDVSCCRRASLSPDGRWLLNGETLYDTETGRATTLTLAAAPRSWSPDGRWMLTECSSEGSGSRQQLLDTTTGTTLDVAGPPSEEDWFCGAAGVFDDGTVIVPAPPAESGSPSTAVSLRVLNPRTGDLVREIDADVTSVLSEDASILGWSGPIGLLVGPRGELFLRTIGGADRRTIGVVVSADGGSPARRVEVADEGGWTPVAFLDQGIVVVQEDAGDGARVSVVTADGAVQPKHHLPPGARLSLLPGAVMG